MSGRIASCELKTGCNEQIEAIVKLPEEKRSVIFGTVLDCNRMPVVDAVVKLLQIVDGGRFPFPLTHTFTDCHGQFLLGPLCPNTKYMLKIYKDNIVIRCTELETSSFKGKCIGKPDDCKGHSPKPFQDKTSCGCDF